MSLESYRKIIDAQRQREPELMYKYRACSATSNNEETTACYEKLRRDKFNGAPWLLIIVTIFLCCIFAVAIVMNPSNLEARKEINKVLVAKCTELVGEGAMGDYDSGLKYVGSRDTVAIVSVGSIETFSYINVYNYILFSTFEVKVLFETEKDPIISGIILFGKIIPFSINIKREYILSSVLNFSNFSEIYLEAGNG